MFIGTGGDMDESVADVQDMAYAPESYDLLAFDNIWEETDVQVTGKVAAFVPSYEFEIIDEDGNSLIEESKVAIMEDWGTKKSTERYRAMTQKPFYLSQMFMMTEGAFFGEEALMHLNEQKRSILLDKSLQICHRAKLEWIDPNDWTKGVEYTPDEDGDFYITQLPEKDAKGDVWVNLYNAATDSYDKDESNTSFSKGSCTIWKGVVDTHHTGEHWVARITQRPSEEEGGSYQFYENTIKMCVFYGHCTNQIEYSNVLIFDYYKRKGFEYLLEERPQMVISQRVEDSQANQRYGVEQSFIPQGLNMLRDKLKVDNYALIYKIFDLDIIHAFAKFKRSPKYNCDITISCAINIISAKENEELSVYSQTEEESDEFGGYVLDTVGNINWN